MFRGPPAQTAVSRAKQGSAEIDDTGLIPSFIRDVIFQGFGICCGHAAFLHFQRDINTLLDHFLLNDEQLALFLLPVKLPPASARGTFKSADSYFQMLRSIRVLSHFWS